MNVQREWDKRKNRHDNYMRALGEDVNMRRETMHSGEAEQKRKKEKRRSTRRTVHKHSNAK